MTADAQPAPSSEVERPRATLFPDWILAVRELGSFALIVFMLVYGLPEIRSGQSEQRITLEQNTRATLELAATVRELRVSLENLKSVTK